MAIREEFFETLTYAKKVVQEASSAVCIPYYILYICRLFPPAWVTEISKPSIFPVARSVSVAAGSIRTKKDDLRQTIVPLFYFGDADTLFYNEEFDPGSG